jgi:hypothetical protein
MRQAPHPQPSSTVTTLRALVMLACLVGIPIMAIRGTPYAAMIRSYLVQKLGGSIPEPDTRAGLDEAPPFVPFDTGTPEPSPLSAPVSQPANGYPSTPSDLVAGDPLSSAPPFQAPAPAGQSPPAVQGFAGHPGRQPDAVLANYDRPSNPTNDRGLSHTYPAAPAGGANDYRGKPSPNVNLGPPPQAAQAVGEASTVDQFVYVEKKLRGLGANYYLLENWGDQGECYRFHCRIAVAKGGNFTKHFEATDEQPLGAMARVLADVEAWRRGSPPWEAPPASPPTVGQSSDRIPAQTSSPHGPYVRLP